jgi:two-component system response regulator NreC
VLADAEVVVRDGLRAAFSADGRLKVVGDAADGVTLLALVRAVECDAVLLGLDLPRRGGLQVLEDLADQPDRPAMVVLSMYDDAGHVDRALALGAQGYILKSAPIAEVIVAVTHAVAGGVYLQPTIARAVLQRHLLLAGPAEQTSSDLSRRQLELLRALAIGMTNKEIAHLLDLTQGTVSDYMKDLFARLGVASRAAAVSTGMRRGLIA